MNNWTEQCDSEINRLLDTQDVSEVVAHAIRQIVCGAIDNEILSRFQVTFSHDPMQSIDFGERLLVAAIDKIREEAKHG